MHGVRCFLLCCLLRLSRQQKIVTLRQGAVKGISVLTETRVAIDAFLGIPYVEPPLGRLRFSSPERSKGWNGTLEASEVRPACPQGPQKGDGPGVQPPPEATTEDCLFVNVWAPAAGGGTLYPVVVLFEGDEFVSGWPGRFPGQDLAADGVVVVSASYRLNVFGFFYLGIKEARGNFGILDQYLALLWVRDNVASFGGDPSAVTLVGQGAGAASALLHASSARAQGLFQRVIAMSGSPLAAWAGQPTGGASAMAASKQLAKSLGCFKGNAASVVACMQLVPAHQLLQAFQTQHKGGKWCEIPVPVSESFLPERERYLTSDEAAQALAKISVPTLLGVTANDGLAALAPIGNVSQQDFEQLLQFAEQVSIPSLVAQMDIHKEIAHQLISHHYLARARNGDAEALLAQIIKMYSEAMYHAPHHATATLMSQGSSPTYVYRLGSHPALPSSDLVFHSGINPSGASYGTDLIVLMGQSVLGKALGRRLSVAEDRMVSSIRRFFLNFIRQGNPTPNSYGYSVAWRRFSGVEGNLMSLENQQMRLEPLASEGISLWNSLLPKINALHPTPRPPDKNLLNLHVGGGGAGYKNTSLVLGALSLVLGGLLLSSLVVLKRRYAGPGYNSDDAF